MDHSASTRCEADFRAVKRNNAIGTKASLKGLCEAEWQRDQRRHAERVVEQDHLLATEPCQSNIPKNSRVPGDVAKALTQYALKLLQEQMQKSHGRIVTWDGNEEHASFHVRWTNPQKAQVPWALPEKAPFRVMYSEGRAM